MAALPSYKVNLDMAISDVHYVSHGGLFKPSYRELMADLLQMEGKDILLPRSYQSVVLRPFTKFLEKLAH